jgi:hypothetical protein
MSQYGATKVAAESLIAQTSLLCKLATGTLRPVNQKIPYKDEILQANEHAPEGVVPVK